MGKGTIKSLFINTEQRSSIVNSVSYHPETLYKAYDREVAGRKLFISIDYLKEVAPKLGETIQEALQENIDE